MPDLRDCASERCPSGVEFSGFILEMRTLLAETKGLKGYRAHDGALHSWMRMMTAPELEQNRLDWVDGRAEGGHSGRRCLLRRAAPPTSTSSSPASRWIPSPSPETASGCSTSSTSNRCSCAEERCCGHDLLWTGDRENFETPLPAELRGPSRRPGWRRSSFPAPSAIRS